MSWLPTSQYNQAVQWFPHSSCCKMTKNEVAMCRRHVRGGCWQEGGEIGGVWEDLSTDEFTSLSKWNDIVVNLGATKNNNEQRQTRQNKQHAWCWQRSQESEASDRRGEEDIRKDDISNSNSNSNSNITLQQHQKHLPAYITTMANNNKLHVLPP